jgi:exopolysaccharide biosynthesis protein
MLKKFTVVYVLLLFTGNNIAAQVKWQNVDSLFQPLPASVHIYKTTDSLEGKPNIAYYLEADLKDKKLEFTVDTTHQRRLKPSEYYQRNNNPLLVVNTTFFSFATNQNLNVVIKKGKLVGYNIHTIPGRGKDTFTYRHPFGSAIGISKKRKTDIAWLFTDSSLRHSFALQMPETAVKDSVTTFNFKAADMATTIVTHQRSVSSLIKWKMQTAVGGGPVLLQRGEIKITNNEELKFTGKAIDDKHPRTAMGYTSGNKLIILVIEGRNPGKAEGASLTQTAQLLKDIGCREALNLDGGGSSCMLVNGRETIKVSDAAGQRPVPAVFIIREKRR